MSVKADQKSADLTVKVAEEILARGYHVDALHDLQPNETQNEFRVEADDSEINLAMASDAEVSDVFQKKWQGTGHLQHDTINVQRVESAGLCGSLWLY